MGSAGPAETLWSAIFQPRGDTGSFTSSGAEMEWFRSLIESLPGLAFVVPVVAGALALFKWSLSRHDVQFARRREFLLHWKNPRDLDSISIEILIRQLTGSYLPARVVRRICLRDSLETVQTLHRLSDIWTLVQWDSEAGTVSWKNEAKTALRRSLWLAAAWISYFLFFIVGAGLLAVVALAKPEAPIGLAAVGCGTAFVFAAVVALFRTDAWGAAYKWGEALLRDANRSEISHESVSDLGSSATEP